MNYLVQRALRGVSYIALIDYIKIRDKLFKPGKISNKKLAEEMGLYDPNEAEEYFTEMKGQLTREARAEYYTYLKTKKCRSDEFFIGNMSCLDPDGEYVAGIIRFFEYKFGWDIRREDIISSLKRKPQQYTAEEIETTRKENSIEIKDISNLLDISEVRYVRIMKKIPDGLSEFLMKLFQIIGKRRAATTPEKQLMGMRVHNEMTLEKAAEALGITPKKLWMYEWKNYVPIHLIEPVSDLYKEKQESIPINDKKELSTYANVIKLIRHDWKVRLADIAQAMNLRETTCYNYENSAQKYPPYEYVKKVLELTGDRDLICSGVEKILLNSVQKEIMYMHVPQQTAEYYRKICYYRALGKQEKKLCSRKHFLKACSITEKEYANEKWTASQVKKALKELDLGTDMQLLTSELTEDQKKILACEIDEDKLKISRKKTGETIHQVSLGINRGVRTISAIESGIIPCTPEMLSLLAEYYRQPIEYYVKNRKISREK